MPDWSKPFFSCKGSTCCLTWCFPCVTSGIVGCEIKKPLAALLSVLFILGFYGVTTASNILRAMNTNDDPYNPYDYDNNNNISSQVYLFLYIGSLGCLVLFGLIVVYMRNTMRKQRDIQGSGIEDCLLGICCPECSLCQMYEQLGDEGEGGRIIEGPNA
ncbi:uncharacterized protein LOC142344287 isoform X1 [Convolutriloba macropyga]|uniref:uncharacterized protein LOC142344287 isoform X1 n=2 Tax=Convolutriloba macropyga TaxID=536237 RepID=UPI003F51CBDA